MRQSNEIAARALKSSIRGYSLIARSARVRLAPSTTLRGSRLIASRHPTAAVRQSPRSSSARIRWRSPSSPRDRAHASADGLRSALASAASGPDW